ncbi:ABC transporter F family member 4 [Benincasa hispida]|uniref:ABC transporter F family member 4 n=1 Tax=Benincasa hispida TaxID=102211 RepID=UPI001902ACFE|nr:ABC transporter F family member 4 [Benincasa hispida]
MGVEDTTKITIENTKNEAKGEDLKLNTVETVENGNNKEDKMKNTVETVENGTTEDDKMTNTIEAVTNGTSELEKTNKAVAKGEENGVKEPAIEQGADVEAEVTKMEEEPEIKEDEGINEENVKDEKEEAKIQAMEEDVNPNDKNDEENVYIKDEGNMDLKDEENENAKDGEIKDAKDEEIETKGETEDAKDEVEKVDSHMEEDDKELKDKDPNEEKTKKGRKRKGAVKSKGNNKVDEKEEAEIRTPIIDRPVRERKSVERLVASIERYAVKEFHIEKGRGTPLKDIPNVAFKLSRKKTDDIFRLLHTILFGRRGKAFQIKSNISRFSGFVWHGDEEKQKNKVKEKFDKCNKEKLLELCDVLDIPVVKATTRKEDIIGKLIEFLIAPHATTTVLLAEKEKLSKGKKRKRAVKGGISTPGDSSSRNSAKSRRKRGKSARSEMTKNLSDEDDESEEEKEAEEENDKENENGTTEKSDDELSEQPESEDINDPTDESEEERPRASSKSSSKKRGSVGKARSKKVTGSNKSDSAKSTTKKSSASRAKVDGSDASPKVFSRKKNSEKESKALTPPKSAAKEKPGKKIVKGKEKTKEEKTRPSDDELREAICEILKVVDFTTATFTDILKQLARQFKMDLTTQKSSIKLMIQEELTKLADEAEEEDGGEGRGEGEGDAEKDGKQAAGGGGQKVET